jgi:peptidoglycan/LPS O-acetylase OafA/YrhL
MMVKENINRSFLLDFLKGIAIIAVILYHSGLFTYGYLGVEIFLIVGGYLTMKTLCIFKQCKEKVMTCRLARIIILKENTRAKQSFCNNGCRFNYQ